MWWTVIGYLDDRAWSPDGGWIAFTFGSGGSMPRSAQELA
jgi:hypothetical protein